MIYTHATAASALGWRRAQTVGDRLQRLADRGEPLTVEAGELQQVGARLLITERGLERLRNWQPGRSTGRPRHTTPSPDALRQRAWRARRKQERERE